MSLRDLAAKAERCDDRSNLGQLRTQLDSDDLAELDDLLWGEPHVGHVYAAAAINEAFPDLLARPVTGKQVEEYRKKRR